MTYRQELQKMIADLQKIYDTAGSLRDHSPAEHKTFLNQFRTLCPDLWYILQEHDNTMPDWLANEKTSDVEFNSDDHE